MRCEQLMKRDVQRVRPADDLRSAARKMRDRNVGFLVVCDEEGRAIGTLTDRDLVIRADAEGLDPSATRVREVMTAQVIACRPGEDVGVAERRMREEQKSRIVVTDTAGQVVGVISLSDFATWDPKGAAETLCEIANRESAGAASLTHPEGGLPHRPPGSRADTAALADRALDLPRDARLGLLRTIVPKILADLDPEAQDAFLRDLGEELEHAEHGEPSYDIRVSGHGPSASTVH